MYFDYKSSYYQKLVHKIETNYYYVAIIKNSRRLRCHIGFAHIYFLKKCKLDALQPCISLTTGTSCLANQDLLQLLIILFICV